jgi:nitric oxide reductase activation protein
LAFQNNKIGISMSDDDFLDELESIGDFANDILSRLGKGKDRQEGEDENEEKDEKDEKNESEKKARRQCSYCRQLGRTGIQLKRCTACRQTYYCDASCQRAHWSEHKKQCIKR